MLATTIKDGFAFTLDIGGELGVTLGLDPTSMTPPGWDMGDNIDTSTQSNTAWRTFQEAALATVQDAPVTVAYSLKEAAAINALRGVNTSITFNFPNGDSIQWYGHIKTFEFGEITEGDMPTATLTLAATNVNSTTGVEAGPVWTPAV